MTDLLGLDGAQVWTTELAFDHLREHHGVATKRTAERRLHELEVVPAELTPEALRDEAGRDLNRVVLDWSLERARIKRRLVLFLQLHAPSQGGPALHANDARGSRYWVPLRGAPSTESVAAALASLQAHIGKDTAVYPHGPVTAFLREAAL
ncbi:MAG TPA: sulfate adenylyltransferase subunit CysD, partial [Telluria sp.]|nr:sulfate adenylyltransferase subunit CysD [Telluria sp.]